MIKVWLARACSSHVEVSCVCVYVCVWRCTPGPGFEALTSPFMKPQCQLISSPCHSYKPFFFLMVWIFLFNSQTRVYKTLIAPQIHAGYLLMCAVTKQKAHSSEEKGSVPRSAFFICRTTAVQPWGLLQPSSLRIYSNSFFFFLFSHTKTCSQGFGNLMNEAGQDGEVGGGGI